MHALIADDEPQIVAALEAQLTKRGWAVETANNGVDALAKVHERIPDLLLLDVMMPEMDGFELLSILRDEGWREKYQDIMKVVVMTARPNDRSLEEYRGGYFEYEGQGTWYVAKIDWYARQKKVDMQAVERVMQRLMRPSETIKIMPNDKPFLGLRTVIYAAPDLEKAKAWYEAVLEIAPYFDQPFYVGFNVGGYELGLDPDAPPATGSETGGVVAYWGVANAEAAFARLLEHGATEKSGVEEVGGGIKVAVVFDPFGNTLGIIENPHFALPVEGK